jgi:uncharacterized protein (TIGR00730 family)
MKSICVYIGGQSGNSRLFSEITIQLGELIAQHKLTLIYGGSSLGLMGLLATTIKNKGGRVIGILPKPFIDMEQPLTTLDELILVESTQARKHLMQQKSDMFLAMPGGLGTMDEVFDTWAALRLGLLDKKPLGFLNQDGYFDHLFAFMANCERHGFVSRENNAIPRIQTDLASLLNDLMGGL